MQVKELYKFYRSDGGVDVSPIQPDGDYDVMYRVIANDGKLVTLDGENCYMCIDTASAEDWYEVDNPNWIPERDFIV